MSDPKPKVMCLAFTDDMEEELAEALKATGCCVLAIFEGEEYDAFIEGFAQKIVSDRAN